METILILLIKNIQRTIAAILLLIIVLCLYALLESTDLNKASFVHFDVDDAFTFVSGVKPEINENYYSGLIAIIVSLFALALPLAVNAITANQDKRFSNNEMGASFYKNKEYLFMKRIVLPLIAVTLFSYFKKNSFWIDGLTSGTLIYVLIRFGKFMKVVEGYVANFPNILLQEEKQKIRKTLER
jgi:uncharacterized membrane protein